MAKPVRCHRATARTQPGVATTTAGKAATTVPPHLYFVASAIFHYLGPAFAVLLFARLDALGFAWLRIASAAAIFALWRRPWRTFARLDGQGRQTLVAGAPCLRS